MIYLIAEVGSTHGGDLDAAAKMVETVAKAGADAVKFQYWSDPARLATRRHAPELATKYAAGALLRGWLPVLKAQATAHAIDFLCTVYLPEDIDAVVPLVDAFKVASFEALDWPFLRSHPDDRTMFISTGLCTARDIHSLRAFRASRQGVSLLHCISAYPTPARDANLAAIRSEDLNGWSDHTGVVTMGAWAVCAGARVIEVHARPDDCDPTNPDYPHSLAPEALATYIAGAREAERVMGPAKRIMPGMGPEGPNLKYRVCST